MLQVDQQNRDRMKSAAGVAAFHALLGYAFLTGLGFDATRSVEDQLKLFNVPDEVPPPPEPPAKPVQHKPEPKKKPKPKDPEGAASPANLRDTPTQVVAPKPKIVIPVPPPVVVAPIAGLGSRPSAGAADVPGPGTGAGGIGHGLGSGAYGTGTGGGGGGGAAIRARLIRGSIRDSDYPRRAVERRSEGVVYLRFVVAPDGRVSRCDVTRSSGHPELDATTCRLILQRFRYRPARDAYGNPVSEVIRGEHVWELGPERPPIEIEADVPEDW